jgi:hypothetical protein
MLNQTLRSTIRAGPRSRAQRLAAINARSSSTTSLERLLIVLFSRTSSVTVGGAVAVVTANLVVGTLTALVCVCGSGQGREEEEEEEEKEEKEEEGC